MQSTPMSNETMFSHPDPSKDYEDDIDVLKWLEENDQILQAKQSNNVRRKRCGCAIDDFCDDCSGYDNAKQDGLI